MGKLFDKFNPKEGQIIENEKPHILNRIISALIDACIVFLAFTGLYTLIINTSMADGMHKYYDEMTVIQDSYLFSVGLGEKDYDIHKEEYSSYRVYLDDQGKEFVIIGIEPPNSSSTKEEQDDYIKKYDEYMKLVKNDASYQNASTFSKLHNFGFVSLSAFIVEGIFYLGVPLIDKKRRTIGKIFAKSKLISTKDLKTPKWHQILGSFSWKLIVESLIPFVFMNQVTFLVMATIQFIFIIINKDNRALHDLVSSTKVVIDVDSSSKKI